MSILSGYGKFKRYVLTSTGYKLCSQWTSSNTVHFDDGNTAQTKLGAISGISDSLTSTSSNIALSVKSGKSLQDQITSLNTSLSNKLDKSGTAAMATALTTSTGSATQPVYFSSGKPVACTYTLGKSVPSNAVFTDTNTWRGLQDNLTSTSTTESLSANQGRLLANGSARDSTKFAISGGDITGGVSLKPASTNGYGWLDFYYRLSSASVTNTLSIFVDAYDAFVRANINTLQLSGKNFLNLRSPGIQCRSFDDTAWSGISASAFVTQSNSSRKLKDNVRDITNEVAKKILDVQVVSFDYKEGVVDEKYRYNRTGVIAEDTESVCPEVINYENGSPMGVQYDRFIPYLIRMVQIQQEEIEQLKSKLNDAIICG